MIMLVLDTLEGPPPIRLLAADENTGGPKNYPELAITKLRGRHTPLQRVVDLLRDTDASFITSDDDYIKPYKRLVGKFITEG